MKSPIQTKPPSKDFLFLPLPLSLSLSQLLVLRIFVIVFLFLCIYRSLERFLFKCWTFITNAKGKDNLSLSFYLPSSRLYLSHLNTRSRISCLVSNLFLRIWLTCSNLIFSVSSFIYLAAVLSYCLYLARFSTYI